MAMIKRTSFNVAYSVWRALFLREATDRLFGQRGAWFALFFEPALHIAVLMLIFSVIRHREVGGMEIAIWIMAGLLSYFMFARSASQATSAVTANRALYTFRQVRPVDTIFVRVVLEAFLMIVITIIMLIGAGLFGLNVIPADPLSVLVATAGLWIAGIGVGLIFSVAVTIAPETGKVVGVIFKGLYITSGVILPLQILPSPYREWVMLNPMLHGVEAVREGFSPYYYGMPGLDLTYLFKFATFAVFFGLALHLHYSQRLATK